MQVSFSPDSQQVLVYERERQGTTDAPKLRDHLKVRAVPSGAIVREEKDVVLPARDAVAKVKAPGKDSVLAVNRPATVALVRPSDPGAKEVYLWNIAEQKAGERVPAELAAAPALAISDDGRRLAFVDPFALDAVRIWDAPSKRVLVTLATGMNLNWFKQNSLATAAGFSPDASLIALHGSFDGTAALLVFEIDTGNLMAKVPMQAYRSAWSPDGRWLATACDQFVQAELERGAVSEPGGPPVRLLVSEVVRPVTGLRTSESVTRLAFSPDGGELSINRTLLRTRKDDRRCGLVPPREEGAGAIRYASKDQRWRIEAWPGDADTKIFWLDQQTPKQRRIELKHPGFTDPPFFRAGKPMVARPFRFALSPDGKQLVSSLFVDYNKVIGIGNGEYDTSPAVFALESWDIEKQQRTAIWNADDPHEAFLSVEFCNGGACVLTASDRGVKLWDARTGAVLRRFPPVVQVFQNRSLSHTVGRGKLHMMVWAESF